MVSVPLEWKLSVQGAAEVKSKLSEINSAFERGEISASDYSKELRSVNRDARALSNISNTQKNIFLATNPVLSRLSRGLSTLNSISRTGLAISNAINLAKLAGQGLSNQEIGIQLQLIDAQNEFNKALDPATKEEAADKIALLRKELENLADQKNQSAISDTITLIAAIGTTAATTGNLLIKNGPAIKGFAEIIGSLSIAGGIATIASLAGLFVGVAAGAFLAGQAIGNLVKDNLGALEFFYWQNILPVFTGILDFFMFQIPLALGETGSYLANFFTNDLPTWAGSAWTALTAGFTGMWNGIIKLTEGAINGMLGGLQSFVNSGIKIINKLISAWNKIAKKLGLGTIGHVGTLSIQHVTLPTIAAANGFDGMVNSPTLFLTGEAGPEHVSVTPSGKSGGSGSITIIQNIRGSVLSEREVQRIANRGLKDGLKRLGW